MSIYHLRANETIESISMLQDTEVNFVSGERFRLRALRERATGSGDTDKDKFDTNITITPSSNTWITNVNVEGGRMTRHKLHYHKETGKMRKLFTFKLNYTVQVNYALRAGVDVVNINFFAGTFENFFPINSDTGNAENLVLTYSGSFSNDTSFATKHHGVIRSFLNIAPNEEGFTMVLLPNTTLPTTGTDVWYIQATVEMFDSEFYDIDRASN
jgi:hypothetical protein